MHAYPAAAVDTGTIRERIGQLEAEHHGLDCLIGKMAEVPGINDLEIRRLKKRKLKVKDTIILLQLQLDDCVLDLELALLEAPDLEVVDAGNLSHLADKTIQAVMLRFQLPDPFPDRACVDCCCRICMHIRLPWSRRTASDCRRHRPRLLYGPGLLGLLLLLLLLLLLEFCLMRLVCRVLLCTLL